MPVRNCTLFTRLATVVCGGGECARVCTCVFACMHERKQCGAMDNCRWEAWKVAAEVGQCGVCGG